MIILNKKLYHGVLAFILALLVSGCAYKIEIVQGNEQLLEFYDDVKPGMTQSDVQDLLGPPNPRLFKNNIWLYTYRLRDPGFVGDARTLSIEIHFDSNNIVQDIHILRNDYADDAQTEESAG